jgi:hypothetical protein
MSIDDEKNSASDSGVRTTAGGAVDVYTSRTFYADPALPPWEITIRAEEVNEEPDFSGHECHCGDMHEMLIGPCYEVITIEPDAAVRLARHILRIAEPLSSEKSTHSHTDRPKPTGGCIGQESDLAPVDTEATELDWGDVALTQTDVLPAAPATDRFELMRLELARRQSSATARSETKRGSAKVIRIPRPSP